MLLLDQETVSFDNARIIAVVSQRENILSEVAQVLRTRGLENIEIVKRDLFVSSEGLSFSAENYVGVIIDTGNESNNKTIINHVFSIVPQNVWCCVIGDSDSISLSQKLLGEGVLYFNSHTQLIQMADKIVSGVNIPRVRDTVKIAILGCKGGIGTSLISAHIASEIARTKAVPTLLAQGLNGSHDLDLLFDKRLSNSITEGVPHLDLFDGNLEQLSKAVLDKYNFIIYDQALYNVHKDDFSHFLNEYSNVVLVVERKISSLRVAKQLLDECERIRSSQGKPIRTFVCISDSRLETSKLMAKSDIQVLLGTQVDGVIPFIKNTNTKTVLDINLGKEGKKEINSLAMKIIGAVSRNNKSGEKEKKTLFSQILEKLINK